MLANLICSLLAVLLVAFGYYLGCRATEARVVAAGTILEAAGTVSKITLAATDIVTQAKAALDRTQSNSETYVASVNNLAERIRATEDSLIGLLNGFERSGLVRSGATADTQRQHGEAPREGERED